MEPESKVDLLLSNSKENFSFTAPTRAHVIPQNAFVMSASPGEECLTLALKGRCQNQMKRRQTGPERLLDNVRLVGGPLRGGTLSGAGGPRVVERATGGLCEVHFLPLVVEVGDGNRTQRLRCVGESTCFSFLFFSPFLWIFHAIFARGSFAYLVFCHMGR